MPDKVPAKNLVLLRREGIFDEEVLPSRFLTDEEGLSRRGGQKPAGNSDKEKFHMRSFPVRGGM